MEEGLGARLKRVERTAPVRVVAQPAVESPMVHQEADTAVETNEEDDVPVGPSDEEESVFLGEEASNHAVSAPPVTDEAEPIGDLPPLEELIKRIPQETLKTMDELFRAKFVHVKRVSAKDLRKR
uniref:hypothetical protein n=2 Tax=Cephaloticoccus sp. TaxID=1985742 RepID=UPI00404AA4FA